MKQLEVLQEEERELQHIKVMNRGMERRGENSAGLTSVTIKEPQRVISPSYS